MSEKAVHDARQSEQDLFQVVINHEEQYSIWPDGRENAPGWRSEGTRGTKQECLDHIEAVWTDMRPLSLRKEMERLAAEEAEQPIEDEPVEDEEPSLVERLSNGDHPVTVAAGPKDDLETFARSVERGYVHVKFTETRGGTELGFRLDQEESDLGEDLRSGEGKVHLVGRLTLDFEDVICRAEIDLQTLEGTGCLQPIEAASP
ncbi:MAG: MbtH family NRPS accessory protein [Thermoanaerobaculia bacterium]|nr:MbtH family NRPS accessory protein [Thermoanaerobaculia bacterium]